MCVKKHLRVTLSGTTVTLPENTEVPLITRATWNCNWDHNHTYCLPQSAGLWLSPPDASHLRGRRKGGLHPKQHGEKYLFLLGPTAIHRQRPVLAGLPWQAGGGKQAGGPSKYRSGTSPAVKGESFCCAKACTHTSKWTPGSTMPSPNCPPPQGSLLQQAFRPAHQWRWLCPCAKGVGDFRVLQPGGQPRPLQPHRRAPPRKCLRDLPEDLHAIVQTGYCTLLQQPRPQLGCPAQEVWSGAGGTDRLWQ